MSWLARQPLVASIITGATRPDQLDANIKATAWALTADELAEIHQDHEVGRRRRSVIRVKGPLAALPPTTAGLAKPWPASSRPA